MASVIYYKFKSNKNFAQIVFESSEMPLWEFKYEIITQRRMNSKDFDLVFYDHESGETIQDEYTAIQRNSYIVVQRIPIWMSNNTIQPRNRKTEQFSNKKVVREPPESYTCFRCGNKGHFIQYCPTNNDPNFDILKIRKPSGIPKDFLEKVEGNLNGTSAILVTDDGFVKAKPQTQEWARKGNARKYVGEIPDEFRCPNCHGILNNPMLTDCGHLYCDGCILYNSKCIVCTKIVKRTIFNEKMSEEIKKYLQYDNYEDNV